jgi:hypothetical protein
MAQVAQDAQLRYRIEHSLDYLINEWEGIPELAAEWGEWDRESRRTFVFNWPVPADHLHQLQQWAEQDVLTPEQRERYDRLMELVAEHRPTLERLLAD